MAIYNRALSSAEIQAIYDAQSAGKCLAPAPPFIFSQPTNQTAVAGETVTFSVVADGPQPLSYQWRFNTTNTLVGATNASLTLAHVQLSQAGNYAVQVSNTFDVVVSSNVVLTVNPAPPCLPAPSGIVGWWPGGGDTLDHAGTNKGTVVGNTTYGTGRVGQGFVFDGNGDGVQLGNPLDLQLQNFTIEAWIKRANASIASFDPGGGQILACGYGGYALGINDNGTLYLTRIGIDNVVLGTGITDTGFHHVAVTKSGNAVFFYIDGAAYSVPPIIRAIIFLRGLRLGCGAIPRRTAFLA